MDWRVKINYTPIISAMVTVGRAFVVYQAYQSRSQSDRAYRRIRIMKPGGEHQLSLTLPTRGEKSHDITIFS